MEKIKLTAETFDSVMLMLQSSDKESVVLGLTCIEELDLTSGLVYLLLLKKLANVNTTLWEENAPKKEAFLKNIRVQGEVFTYKKILDLLVERKVPTSDIQFFLTKFGDFLYSILKTDYPILENIDVNLKLKLHEPEISKE